MPYAYLTLAQLRTALLTRLQDSAGVNTTAAEANLYLTEGLRVLNALTQAPGITDYLFDFDSSSTWASINVAGSPRQRTVTDTDIFTEMEYHLLEPPSGSTWTGTDQFSIANLSNALQYRLNELLLVSGVNTVNLLQSSPVGSNRSTLSDTLLDLRRVRWIPAVNLEPGFGYGEGGYGQGGYGGPVPVDFAYALWREDRESVDAFGVFLGITDGPPDSWLITANSPLQFDVSQPPNVPGTWDMLVIESGATLAPPATTILGLPDDWCWVAKYGALADLLSNSPEAVDQQRAKYCLSRYERGMKAMLNLPWLLAATVSSIPVDTPSYLQMDMQEQNWEITHPVDDPTIVIGGIDFIALAPFISPYAINPIVSAILTIVGNAPIPVLDSNLIQLSRDGIEAVLNYAQHIAMFKTGGADFIATLPLFKQFEDYCAAKNHQYAALGIYRPEMLLEGNRSEAIDPRFEREAEVAHGAQAR